MNSKVLKGSKANYNCKKKVEEEENANMYQLTLVELFHVADNLVDKNVSQ